MPSSEPPAPPAEEPTSKAPIRADLAHSALRETQFLTLLRAVFIAGGTAAVLFVGLWVWKYAFSDLPPIPDKAALWAMNRPAGATFLDREGRVIGQRGPRHGAPLSLTELPAYLPEAFLAAEDRRFYSHMGVDLLGVVRAARNDLFERRRALQGGSTITQQIARTLFLTPDQTLRRKLQEAVLAFEIERRMSKRDILELYLNRIYFGGGAYGVEAAAETYFGVDAKALTLPQAALLAALPKAPTHLAPTNDLEAALARSRLVLQAMRQDGWISPAQEAAARAEPPRLSIQPAGEGDLGYVLDLAAREAREANVTNVPDLVIRLTIDSRLQAEATQAVRAAVQEGRSRGATQGAMVALGPDGGVLALVGGLDHRLSSFDRATQALRQPGSSFKPLVYAAALEAGLHPWDVRPDAPIRIGDWRPQNADGLYRGPVTLAEALAQSINTVAVRVSQETGPQKVAALAQRFGLVNIPSDASAPIALGAYEVTLLDLASAYQVLQQQGLKTDPYLVSRITDARGVSVFERRPGPPPRVYDAQKAAALVEMMQGVITHGTARRADIGRPAAGKTGTSQDYRDAWFIGFTPELLAGVWLGDDHDRPMERVMGGELPAEAWKRFMLAAEGSAPVQRFPDPPPRDAPAAPSDPRAAFYGTLARLLDRSAAPTLDPEPPEGEPR